MRRRSFISDASQPLVLAAVAAGAVLVAQVPIAVGLLDPDAAYEAGHAAGVLLANALLAVLTVAAAALLPAPRRALALLPGALTAAVLLGGALTVGGHAWDAALALLTLLAAWWTGRLVLRVVGAAPLRDVAVVELAIGTLFLGLVVFALGRAGLLAWWSAGALTIVLGCLGARTGAQALWDRKRGLWSAVTDSPIATACAGLLLLQLGWAAVWISAPEIMYDALSGKAYLPELWASSGSIGTLLDHPVLNFDAGLAALVAVPGHAVGARDVGRWLQLLSCATLIATIWWWAGRRSVVGPLAALAIGVAPQFVWQSTTAYDDVLVAVAGVALAVAALRTLGTAERAPSWGTALAIGLLAGACVWFKLHLLAVAAAIVVAWVVAAGPRSGIGRRAGGVALGLLAAAPAFLVRWLDTGNPVFPAYNSIFASRHYPPIDDHYNFPFWPDARLWDALRAPYEAVAHPQLMIQATPPGGFGLLVPVLVATLLLGWRHRDRRGALVLWGALAIGLALWWVHFRDLRYLVPTALLALVLLGWQAPSWRPSRAGAAALLVSAGLASVAFLPSTIASFWNVPGRELPFAAAFGRWDADAYLRQVFTEKEMLDAYQRLAPPGAVALSSLHQRALLTDHDLSPQWEVARLLQLPGPPPTTPGRTYRRLRRLGIGWAIVDPRELLASLGWLAPLLRAHGQPVFADGSLVLYRLVATPAPDADGAG